MDFAKRLNELMQITGISRYRISKEIGCSPSTVTNWLNGTDPTADRIQQVADYFGVSADYLLGQSSHRYRVTKGFLRLRHFLGPEYHIDTYHGWCFLCLVLKKGFIFALQDIPDNLSNKTIHSIIHLLLFLFQHPDTFLQLLNPDKQLGNLIVVEIDQPGQGVIVQRSG